MRREQEIIGAVRAVALEGGLISCQMTDSQVSDIILCSKDFDWGSVAEIVRMPKPKVKRWFSETYQRHLHGPVPRRVSQCIREMIEHFFDAGG